MTTLKDALLMNWILGSWHIYTDTKVGGVRTEPVMSGSNPLAEL